MHSPAVFLLEIFAERARVPFDRSRVVGAVAEATRGNPGESSRVWAQRLIDVGQALSLRIRWAECSFRDSLAFVGQGIPVATPLEATNANGDPEWLVLQRVIGNKIEWVRTDDLENVRRSTRRQLQKQLKLQNNGVCNWVIAQSAMNCTYYETGSSKPGTDDGKPVPPLRRLLSLIAPERRDIWSIVIYSIVVGLLALASPIAVEALVNTVAFGRYLQPVVILALILLIFLSFAAAMRALMAYMAEIIQRRLFVRVVEDLAYRLPRARFNSWDSKHGPELVNRFFDVVTVQKVAAALLLDGLAIILQTVIGMVVLAFYHPFLLGFDFAILAFLLFVIFILGRGAIKTAVYESKAKYSVASWLQDLSAYPTAFKMHGGSQFALDRADRLAINYIEARRRHFRIVMRQIVFALGLQALAATVLLGLGGWLVIIGQLTLGQLVAAELIITVIVGSFAKLGKHMEGFYDLNASVDKLGNLFDLKTEPQDRVVHSTSTQAASLLVSELSLKVGSQSPVSKFNLTVQPGEHVVITGRPGSGKSLFLEAVAGLRDPASGRIELDSIDLRELRADSLRHDLGLSRQGEVFQGTVAENVHLYRPQLNSLDVRRALGEVGLLDDVLALADGFDTQLQPSGRPLSNCQASRLMVARAIAARPRLLLIDGTLDGLPSEVLEQVMEQLTAPGQPWTMLIASHRQEVINACTRTVDLGSPVKPSKQLV